MQSSLDIEEALTQVSIADSGVLATDRRGLCIGSTGIAPPRAAGSVANIARTAAKLGTRGSKISVCIETEASVVLILGSPEHSVAIFKPTQAS